MMFVAGSFWLVFVPLFVFLPKHCQSDILYLTFNDTTGLKFNGASGTTNCFNDLYQVYGDVQGKADRFDEPAPIEFSETTDILTEYVVHTNVASDNFETDTSLAGYLNRVNTTSAPTTCAVRSRLTPSGPSKAGSMWYRELVPISEGFDTLFTFQISDHSKECTLHKDQYFSVLQHRTCSVHGGDGFAFVIQNDKNATHALGGVGGHMGFGGISNSIAIAFDMFSNPGLDQISMDHVSIQSKGKNMNSGYEDALLGTPVAADLADGNIHLIRISYYGELLPQYFNNLVASESLLPYLKDNGEKKRLGTLLVYVDDGVISDTPLLAMPINLSVLLDLPSDHAYVGFTSSTGKYWEKHDILQWYWCDRAPCERATKANFDYHQHRNVSLAKIRYYAPGNGFGGSDGSEGFPTKMRSPKTNPWKVPVNHHSLSRNEGLAPDSTEQLPGETLYRS